MVKILAVVNQKGGVGKTTTCVNLAASLAAARRRVLLVDIDPQGNATMGCGVDKHDLHQSIYDVLHNPDCIHDVIFKESDAKFHVLPANRDLTAAEIELLHLTNKETRLKQALNHIKEHYDFVLIDCPPSLSLLTINALVAAHGVLIPMQCEYYALEGLSDLLNTMDGVKKTLNPHLKIEGILRTMYDTRTGLTTDVTEQLNQHFGTELLETTIPRNIRLAEAPSHGLPVLNYDAQSKGAQAYLSLAAEMLRRQLPMAAG